jgi:hypothetical protein
MNTLRIFLGSVIVYFAVSTIYGCSSPSTMRASGTAGGRGTGGTTSGAGGKGTGGAGGKGTGGATGGMGGGSTGPVPNAEAEESGSRIKARWIVGDDGSKQFLIFYDSMLKVECQYQFMSDGKRHCTPGAYGPVAYGPLGLVVGSLYQDAACSAPLAMAPAGSACPPQYAFAGDSTSQICGPSGLVLHWFPVGTKYTGSVYWKNGGPCSATQPPTGQDLFTVGAELPPSMFVGSTITTDP